MQQLGQTAKLVAKYGCKIKNMRYIEIHIKIADISDLSYMSEYKRKICMSVYVSDISKKTNDIYQTYGIHRIYKHSMKTYEDIL